MRQRGRFGEDPKIEAAPVPKPRQTLDNWAADVCRVKDCYDGFISRDIRGYSTLFGCPVCTRWNRDLAGYTSVPTIKRWMGNVELYTSQEMIDMVNRRIEVVEGMKRGAGRQPELELDQVGDGPF